MHISYQEAHTKIKSPDLILKNGISGNYQFMSPLYQGLFSIKYF